MIVVHLYGYPAPLPDTDLPIVEDAAQAHGALHDPGRSAATAYSFYPTKVLGGIGDGGAVVTTSAAIDATVRTMRTHGMSSVPYRHTVVSQNFRMSELEAAWLTLAMDDLDADIARRRAIATKIRCATRGVRWQEPHPDHAYHLLVLRSAERDALRAALGERGVGTAVHYPYAVHQQPAYASLTDDPLPESTAWAAECVSVPCFPEITDEEISTVIDALEPDGGAVTRSLDVRSVSAIFPCYNDEPTIGGLVDDVHAALTPLVCEIEVIVVNDGSRDGSRELLDALAVGPALAATDPPRAQRWVRRGADHRLLQRRATTGSSTPTATRSTTLARRRCSCRWPPPTSTSSRATRSVGATPWYRKVIGRMYHHVVKLLFGLHVRDTDCDFRLFRRQLFVDHRLTSTSGVICVEMMRTFEEAGARFVRDPGAPLLPSRGPLPVLPAPGDRAQRPPAARSVVADGGAWLATDCGAPPPLRGAATAARGWAFWIAFACSLVVLYVGGRHQWFIRDDWALLLTRQDLLRDHGVAEWLFQPQDGHWLTVPAILFRALAAVFGLGSYWPFLLTAMHPAPRHRPRGPPPVPALRSHRVDDDAAVHGAAGARQRMGEHPVRRPGVVQPVVARVPRPAGADRPRRAA